MSKLKLSLYTFILLLFSYNIIVIAEELYDTEDRLTTPYMECNVYLTNPRIFTEDICLGIEINDPGRTIASVTFQTQGIPSGSTITWSNEQCTQNSRSCSLLIHANTSLTVGALVENSSGTSTLISAEATYILRYL
ncbi:hypothetical protein [Microbulbifer sp. TYP-18]|uniref:hypothetical protein n=1 Tax=Microbulbifer sp. TYP-18 TaxID=3230024 RepID=UPI0034C5C96A